MMYKVSVFLNDDVEEVSVEAQGTEYVDSVVKFYSDDTPSADSLVAIFPVSNVRYVLKENENGI